MSGNNYIHIDKICKYRYVIRFYNVPVLIDTHLNLLPDYIGRGDLEVFKGQAFISGVVFNEAKGKFSRNHRKNLYEYLRGVGVTEVEFERHRNNRTVQRKSIKIERPL